MKLYFHDKCKAIKYFRSDNLLMTLLENNGCDISLISALTVVE